MNVCVYVCMYVCMYMYYTHYVVYGFVEAVVLAEDEEDYEQHVDVVGAITTTVVQLLQEGNHLMGRS